jgi:hypothetical protein
MADHGKLAPPDDLVGEIQDALRRDKASGEKLKHGSSREDGLEFDGYCAVASEAYFYISGARLVMSLKVV